LTYTDGDLEGGVELSTRLMQTASREIDILSGPGGGSDDSTISGLLDVATRNEDANYVILTGEYPPGVDQIFPGLVRTQRNYGTRPWRDCTPMTGGITERLF